MVAPRRPSHRSAASAAPVVRSCVWKPDQVLPALTKQRAATAWIRARPEKEARTWPAFLRFQNRLHAAGQNAHGEPALALLGRERRYEGNGVRSLAGFDRHPLPRPERPGADEIRDGVSALGSAAHDVTWTAERRDQPPPTCLLRGVRPQSDRSD